ncbi:MAG TPA: DMT family transporter [Symbiobacteriaceae bacterium]|nr:DMT family transporter [Symbiobacteriaceae bacterium]
MPRWFAVLAALFVTFLWSTSYILNKWAFAEGIHPFALAGLRYAIAALTLALVRATRKTAASEKRISPWIYAGLGVAGYLVAQGFQYVGQFYVTPTQSGMVLSVGNTLLVLAVGLIWLGELPGARQGLGIAVSLLGVSLFYWPFHLEAENLKGITMLFLSGAGYAVQLTANRALLSRRSADPLSLVLYPMAVGAAGMILLSVLLEPWPAFTWKLAAILLWLGAVNGALAFFLWTWSQKVLQAFESSVLNNTMLLQIVTLDVLLLGRQVGAKEIAGLVLAGVGILVVQTAARRGK